MKSVLPSKEAGGGDDQRGDELILMRTLRFSYHHVGSLVGISVAWVLLSFPVITLGPATLGAYRAIISLREDGEIRIATMSSTIRSNLVPSVLLGVLPIVVGSTTVLYVTTLTSDSAILPLGLAVASLYVTAYLFVLLIPTFYKLARNDGLLEAIRESYIWTAGNPTSVVRLFVVTAVLFVVSLLLTVAVVAFFPGFVLSYYVLFLEESDLQ
jgi:hypothetical protein